VLAELADTAQPLSVRRNAARWIQSEPVLRKLAEFAKDAQVRADAQHDLALLEARRRLFGVGRRRRGIVSLAGQRVGVIEELSAGGTRFTYDLSWLDRPDAKAIAISLPLRHAPYESEGLLPFFENLLPEGWLLDLARRKLGSAASDAFGLLLATCGDCAGAVEIAPAPEEQAA
jgi:HipA-like protein